MTSSSVTPTASTPGVAQTKHLPSQSFYSVEYPGYVRCSSSISEAIRTLGGQRSLDNAFRRGKKNEGRDNVVDLNFRPDNPFSHPVSGDVFSSSNLLLKVVKRKRKQSSDDGLIGEYTAAIVGSIPKTLRFRSIVDFQYQPDTADSIASLRFSMDNLEAHNINTFNFGAETENYTKPKNSTHEGDYPDEQTMVGIEIQSNLKLIPPPLFSRQGIPLMYNFKQNPMSVIETSVNEKHAEEKKRYISRGRWKGWSVAPLSISEKEVPMQPNKQVDEMRGSANPRLYGALKKHFEERPIWTKLALLNQFSAVDAREIFNTKYLIPLCCYVFIDGPWRDTLVRFGYDPRNNMSSRFFQRIYFRNVNNPTIRPSVTTRIELRSADNPGMQSDTDDVKSHVFDGKTQSSETASFQLCDIHDPMLADMINDGRDLREACHERDGWYTTTQLDRIKVVLRHKFFSLLEGRVATDDECRKLLSGLAESKSSLPYAPTYSRKTTRKHNKAKGALPPEEEAAARLRKALAKGKEAEH